MSIVDLFSSAIQDIQSTRYAQLASGTIILYDHLVTIDEEVELIWSSSWSWGKGLFILNRYYALISVIVNTYGLFSPHLTSFVRLHFFRWQGWTGLIACMIAEVILQMRLYAMYSLNKKILLLMGGCFIIATSACATVMGTVLSKISAAAVQLTPEIIFCVPSDVSTHFFAFWIPMLAFETLLCGLAIFKGYQTFKSSSSPFLSGKHLVSILIRDSILYFLVMFATYLTNLLVWITARQTLLEIPIGFSVALSCVMGNRIILNVREVNREMEHARSTSQKLPSHLSSTRETYSTRSRSIVIPGESTLSQFEMAQLRAIRADR
ncbi:hypothetical protein Hypma_001612 [Hypsizygus marmoreus]|uniref:DUF6533 domain-containing protein n=1 Tax=Hypsizygus marmoreus TaxID=39966 RepID=A0A369J5V6_HYPMA|nr:hypothetical protein Hypma_001612 [Hypsizygus marmoreus]